MDISSYYEGEGPSYGRIREGLPLLLNTVVNKVIKSYNSYNTMQKEEILWVRF